jgi:hypothetical protein
MTRQRSGHNCVSTLCVASASGLQLSRVATGVLSRTLSGASSIVSGQGAYYTETLIVPREGQRVEAYGCTSHCPRHSKRSASRKTSCDSPLSTAGAFRAWCPYGSCSSMKPTTSAPARPAPRGKPCSVTPASDGALIVESGTTIKAPLGAGGPKRSARQRYGPGSTRPWGGSILAPLPSHGVLRSAARSMPLKPSTCGSCLQRGSRGSTELDFGHSRGITDRVG